MEIRDKLYKYSNPIFTKTINIDDNIYSKLKDLSEKVYDATYRAIRLRKSNINKLNEYSRKTGISFTRLVNGALKEFLDNQ